MLAVGLGDEVFAEGLARGLQTQHELPRLGRRVIREAAPVRVAHGRERRIRL